MPTNHPSDLILGCQVARALKIIGDRWAFLILRDVFLGYHRFEDIRRRTGAARGTLTSRLNGLQEHGILEKRPYQDAPRRYEYWLTPKGEDLYPLALTAWRWEHTWAADQDHELPSVLRHDACGKVMLPELRCRHCNDYVEIREVTFAPGPGLRSAEPVPPRFQRRTKARQNYPEGVVTQLFHLADIVGDRWTGLVVAALFFGLHRYDEIGAAIGIATNILADRLKLLTETGIVERTAYEQRPVRHEYRLTDKGRDLYGHTLMMHQWANRWIIGNDDPPLLLTHDNCGQPLEAIVVCSECGESLELGSVSFEGGG